MDNWTNKEKIQGKKIRCHICGCYLAPYYVDDDNNRCRNCYAEDSEIKDKSSKVGILLDILEKCYQEEMHVLEEFYYKKIHIGLYMYMYIDQNNINHDKYIVVQYLDVYRRNMNNDNISISRHYTDIDKADTYFRNKVQALLNKHRDKNE